MQKIRGPKSGPLNRAATSSHQHRPEHGIAQHHPLTSTVRSIAQHHPHTSTVRSTVSCSTILTPAPSAAGYRTATSHQHRPQQGIPQRHRHPAASAAGYRAATSIWMQKIRGPKSGPLNHAAASSHQQRPQQGIAQQPHTSIIRGRVLSSIILTQQHPRQDIAQQHPSRCRK